MSTTSCIGGFKITRDPSTAVPLHYLSLLLKYTVPKDFIWDQNLKKIIEWDNFRQSYGDKARREEKIVHAGSSVEGLTVPKFYCKDGFLETDIDKLYLETNTFYFHLPFEHAKY